MSSEATGERPKPPKILMLPLEIRLMILKHLLYKVPRVTSMATRKLPIHKCLSSHTDIGPSYRGGQYGFHKSVSLTSIRAVNRQLYQETLQFIKYPRFIVRFSGLIDADSTISDAAMTITRFEFIRRNLVEIRITLDCCDMGLWISCARWKRWDANRRSIQLRPWVTMTSLYKRKFGETETPLTTLGGSSFGRLVEALEQCPSLEHVLLKTSDHGDLLGWWEDPTRDFALFIPLLRRGVEIEIYVERTPTQPSYEDVYKAMIEVLDGEAGEVAMSVKAVDRRQATGLVGRTGILSLRQ